MAVRLTPGETKASLRKDQFFVGEFTDKDQPEWLATYQKIIDQFKRAQDKSRKGAGQE